VSLSPHWFCTCLTAVDITAAQLEILSEVYGEEAVPGIPKMWAMYKEVADYYADGLKVPDDGEWSEQCVTRV
jgi:hypothetical protein